MILEGLLASYLLGVSIIALVAAIVGDNGMGWTYYRGMAVLALLWPYVLYRGLTD